MPLQFMWIIILWSLPFILGINNLVTMAEYEEKFYKLQLHFVEFSVLYSAISNRNSNSFPEKFVARLFFRIGCRSITAVFPSVFLFPFSRSCFLLLTIWISLESNVSPLSSLPEYTLADDSSVCCEKSFKGTPWFIVRNAKQWCKTILIHLKLTIIEKLNVPRFFLSCFISP